MLVSVAAKRLGTSTQTLRLALQQNLYPEFGRAVKTSPKRWTYVIVDELFEAYMKARDYESSNNLSNNNFDGSNGDK